jgi:hypothetical protein
MSEPSLEVNEADLLEQETPVADDDLTDGSGPDLSRFDADEADVAEQRAVVPEDEDEYPAG